MPGPFKMKNSSLMMSAKSGTPINYGAPMKQKTDPDKSKKKTEKTYVEKDPNRNITRTERVIDAKDKNIYDKKFSEKSYSSVDNKDYNYSKGQSTTTKAAKYSAKSTDDKYKTKDVIYTKDDKGKITRTKTKSTKNRTTGKTDTKTKTYTPKTKLGDFIYQKKMKNLNKKSKKNVS